MKNLISMLIILILTACNRKEGEYICTPCGFSCDELTFSKEGICPHCKMALVKKSDLKKEKEPAVNQIAIQQGAGVFLIEGGIGKKDKTIKVYYYRPANLKSDAKVLLVIPGEGRNADSYRDAWIPAAEKYGVLILSPRYAEEDYPFENYHLGGLMQDLNLENCIERMEGTNMITLDENQFTYKVNPNRKEWIFEDFDRIFDLAVKAAPLRQTRYDIFGHSAGGQILHRLALFHPDSKADRIVAANSGFYTLADFTAELPFGLKNTGLTQQDLQSAFSRNLIVCVGELDNQNETRGTLLRSETADQQGLHRLARASFFYSQAKKAAQQQGADFNWRLKIIPDAGHSYLKMGDAAARLLYDK